MYGFRNKPQKHCIKGTHYIRYLLAAEQVSPLGFFTFFLLLGCGFSMCRSSFTETFQATLLYSLQAPELKTR